MDQWWLALLVIIAVAMIAISVWKKHVEPRDILNSLLSFIAIVIAAATYYDAKNSGNEQKMALDESREALHKVVHTLISQNEMQRHQLSLIDAAEERARVERERHPEIKVDLWTAPSPGIKSVRMREISRSQSNRTGAASVIAMLSNTGNGTLESPVVRFAVIPDAVNVSGLHEGVPGNMPTLNIIDFNLPHSVEPLSKLSRPHPVQIQISRIPNDVSKIDLRVSVSGRNMLEKVSTFHLRVTP